MPSKITDHVATALELLLWEYQEKPRIAAWLTSYVQRVQELEDASWDVIIGRMIDYAVGVQLDTLGRLVGQTRQSSDDEVYRARIRARIRANRSLGHPDDIIAVALLAVSSTTEGVWFGELYPASFVVDLRVATDAAIATAVGQLIDIAKPPGVASSLFFSEYDESETFTMAPGDTPVTDVGRGFADDEDPTTAPGGRWIDSI